MYRRKPRGDGFTLIELLLLIAIIAVLFVAVIIPVLSRNGRRIHSGWTICSANLSSIGKGLVIYGSSFKEKYPIWSDPHGFIGGPEGKLATASNNLFLLAEESDLPGNVFVCPSIKGDKDHGMPLEETAEDTNQGTTTFSYSYQRVMEDSQGRAVSSGVKDGSEAGLAIMADRVNDDLSSDEMLLSANHKEEIIFVLYKDGHVGVEVKDSDKVDCGLTKAGSTDNIYTCSGASDVATGDTGHVGNTGTKPYHQSPYDSCLITD